MAHPLRLLIIDDDPDILEWMRAVYDGHYLGTASSVASGLEILGRGRFDVIVLDVDLGDGNGLDVLEAIRSDEALAHIRDTPVVMLTASTSGDAFERAWELGMSAYVVKPFSIETLSRALDEASSFEESR